MRKRRWNTRKELLCLTMVRLRVTSSQCCTDILLIGGRQVDGAIASLDAMYRIGQSQKIRAAQESGKFTVLFDSGIRTGSDIIKAIVFGAQGVLCKCY